MPIRKSCFGLKTLTTLLAFSLLPGICWADAKAGEAIAKSGVPGVPACMSCHGANGEGQAAASYPRLGGQLQAYLVKQLQDFKARRVNPVMQPFAQKLTDQQINDVAEYYASLSPPARAQASPAATPPAISTAATSPAPASGTQSQGNGGAVTAPAAAANPAAAMTRGAQLAQRGNWDKGVPACFACHGPNAHGIPAAFPALAGQNAPYLSKQLIDWQSGARNNDPQGLMKVIAEKLTRDDINAVSAYLERLQ